MSDVNGNVNGSGEKMPEVLAGYWKSREEHLVRCGIDEGMREHLKRAYYRGARDTLEIVTVGHGEADNADAFGLFMAELIAEARETVEKMDEAKRKALARARKNLDEEEN